MPGSASESEGQYLDTLLEGLDAPTRTNAIITAVSRGLTTNRVHLELVRQEYLARKRYSAAAGIEEKLGLLEDAKKHYEHVEFFGQAVQLAGKLRQTEEKRRLQLLEIDLYEKNK